MDRPPALINACQPWEDIVSTGTGISALAVDLDLVTSSRADRTIYGNPQTFFTITYPTEALKKIIRHVFDRVTGRDPHAKGIFLLGTAMGGGKSHILAAIFHLAKYGSDAIPRELAKDFIGEFGWQPTRVVVLTYNAPAGGKEFPRTLWGEMARQLGRESVMKERDRLLQAPTKNEMLEALEGEPTVILIDEVTNYLIRASTVRSGTTTLAEQTRVFLQLLEEVVDELTNTALVVSKLPEEFDAEELETLGKVTKGMKAIERDEVERRARHEVKKTSEILLRKAEPETPVRDDNELVSILKKRLFKTIDESARAAAARALASYYRSPDIRSLLPQEIQSSQYQSRFEQTYPFHPKTITLLRDKLSQTSKFQQTRGAVLLSMLAYRRIYERQDPGTIMIMPYHFDPRDPSIRDELSARLFTEERIQNAIITELVEGPDEPPRASIQDNTFGSELGSRLTTAILLESCLISEKGPQHTLVGANEQDILLDVLQPGEDGTRTRSALHSIFETSYHIVKLGEKCIFQAEVNLNRYIENKAREIQDVEVRAEIQKLLKKFVLRGPTQFEIIWDVTAPEDIYDRDRLQLVVLPPDEPWWQKGERSSAELDALFMKKSQSGETRRNRNAVAFLAPSASDRQVVMELVRKLLAIRRVREDSLLKETLSPDQQKRLEELWLKSEGMSVLRIGMAYKLLFYPWHAGDEFRTPKLACKSLALTEQHIGVDTDSWSKGQSRVLEIIHEVLKEEGKIKGEAFSPQWLKEKVMTDRSGNLKSSLTFKEIQSAFLSDTALPFKPRDELIHDSLTKGMATGDFAVLSGHRLFLGDVEPTIHEDSEVIIIGTERWREVIESYCERCGSPKSGCKCRKTCPECGQPPDQCRCVCGKCGKKKKDCTCKIRCPNCGEVKEKCSCEITLSQVTLRDASAQLSQRLKERKVSAGWVSVSVNRVRDVELALRILPSFPAAQVVVDVNRLIVNARAHGEEGRSVDLTANRPGDMLQLIRGAIEALLGHLNAGKSAGEASLDFTIKFKKAADADALEEALRPFEMPGCERVKADIRAGPEVRK